MVDTDERRASSRAGTRARHPAAATGLAVAFILAAGAPAALAQEVAPSAGAQVYEPGYFTRFAPQTALDMVRNIPGFQLREGERRRGFGQGGVNVIINGRRTSGKSNNASDALGRISVDAVIRIEILDGASLSIPGLSGQVANVVTRPKGLSGSWDWNPQFRADTRPYLARGKATLNGETGAFTYSLGVENYDAGGAAVGPEIVTDASGAVIDVRQEQGEGGGQNPEVTASLGWVSRAGDAFNLNGSMSFPEFNDREVSRRSGPGLVDRVRLFDFGFNGEEYEIGADYEFGLGPGRLKLVALASAEEGGEVARVIEAFADGRPDAGDRFLSEEEGGERILRAEYSLPAWLGGDWQVAAENAFNHLEVASLSATLRPDGAFSPDGPADFTRVEEERSEASLSYSRTLAKGVELQVNLATEVSEISQTGPGGLTREFVRPKGTASLSWKPRTDTDVNFKLERRVGQLDFDDFAASQDLSEETSQAGNVELVPDQSWRGEIEINRRLGPWGAFKVILAAASIEDLVDQIPIYICDGRRVAGPADCPAGVLQRREGVGNIDSAEAFGFGLSGTLKLDRLGFRGGQIELESGFNDSNVTDPVTGETRRRSGEHISYVRIEARQDVPKTDWVWGLGFERFARGARFSLTQRAHETVDPGYVFGFIEHKDVLGLKVRLQTVNPNDTVESFRREIYPDGRDGALGLVEQRDRTFAQIFRLSISDSF